jgi:hypothetical protein
MRTPARRNNATLLIRATDRAMRVIVRPSSPEVPAESGNANDRGDDTFARARAAMAASRVELARSKDLFERTRELVDGSDRSRQTRAKEQDGGGAAPADRKLSPQP